MKKIGVLKSFDNLGRLVIPKEFRERYAFDKTVEVIAVENGVLISNPQYFLTKRSSTNKKDEPISNK